MIAVYRYTVDATVLEVFAAATKRQREQLLRIFAQLAENLFWAGEAVQHDNVGRPVQVRRFGEWIVTYWPEHLAKVVHILALEHLRT